MQPIIHIKLRKDKISNGRCPIILQVYYKKDRKQIFTGLSIDPANWDEVRQEAVGKMRDADHFNRMLKNKVEATEKDYYKQGALTGAIDLHTKTKQSRQNFYDYAYAYYDGMSNRASLHYLNKCKAAIRDFKDFAGNLSFQGVTPQVLKEFEDYLFQLGRARNTINFVFKKLKQPFAQANKEKITDHNPFILYKPVTYKQTARTFLTMDEIKKIETVELHEDLDRIRNYFLLCCYTGLRFSDVQKFDKQKIVVNIKGTERIILGTTKTNEVVSIKVSDNVRGLIAKLNRPLPSNVHTNRCLKAIGRIAGLNKDLTFHKSRHSAAVNMASAGLSIEVVARILGHSNIRTTSIYYKIVDSKLDEAMDKWDKFTQ